MYTISRSIALITALVFFQLLNGQNPLELQFALVAKNLQGNLGVSALLIETGESVAFNGKDKFPMQSVYKIPIALIMLQEIEKNKFSLDDIIKIDKSEYIPLAGHSPIRDKFPNGVNLTIFEILQYNVTESDGTACDVLIRLLGGVHKVQQRLRKNGIENIAIATTEMVQAENDTIQYKNWSTPDAMNKLLEGYHNGKYISHSSKRLVDELMSSSKKRYGRRIKGLLPKDTPVIHKTGTSSTYNGLTRATNDVGIITLPNGNHIAISVFISNSYETQEKRETAIAQVAKFAFEYWKDKP
jgi:beta-lactamase class A